MQPNIMMTNIMICCVMVGLHAMASKKGGGGTHFITIPYSDGANNLNLKKLIQLECSLSPDSVLGEWTAEHISSQLAHVRKE